MNECAISATSVFEDWPGEGPVATVVAVASVLVAAVAVFFALTQVLLPRAAHLALRTKFRWDDVVIDRRFRRWFALMATALLVRSSVGIVPGLNELWTETWMRVSVSLAIAFGTVAASTLLMSINSVYETYPMSRERPIKGYLQVVQIIGYVFGDIWILAVLTNRTPWYLLSGLGAAAAVLLILYRDTIMSLAASLQIAQNDMVRVGDWIEMPDFGANGTVVDMALATVKVQNWDNTITTLPTHRLTSGPVKNWRGMADAGSRRIQFSIRLDISSIRFVQNQAGGSENSSLDPPTAEVCGETNIEALQHYLVTYLEQHKDLETDTAPVMVRQLPPGPNGLPLEVYVFCRETDWATFEAIQGEIISHALASLPRFGLRAFQHPTDAAVRSRSPGNSVQTPAQR